MQCSPENIAMALFLSIQELCHDDINKKLRFLFKFIAKIKTCLFEEN